MIGKLEGKVAIVTGGGDGIGAAIVRRFLLEGAKVLACDISTEKLKSAHPADLNLLLMEQDVAAKHAGDRLILAALKQFGGIDILVNNAGTNRSVTLDKATDKDWDYLFAVNLASMFRLCRAVIPSLRVRRGGRIINIASISAVQPTAGLGIYASAKAGVIALTKTLAIELGPDGITANAILPGPIQTRISRAKFAQEPLLKQKLVDRTALGRMGEPDEIAGAVLFLASNDATFVTGHGLVVDGGTTARL